MRFSVIVPTHNRPELLAAALASVEAQGFTDWECIVVDDGSTVPAVVPTDERFRLIRHDTAVGPAAARNSGIAAARGEVITFLDDDDVYTRDRLWIAADGTRLGADVVICAGEALEGPSSTYPDSVATLFDRSTTHLGMVAVPAGGLPDVRSQLSGVRGHRLADPADLHGDRSLRRAGRLAVATARRPEERHRHGGEDRWEPTAARAARRVLRFPPASAVVPTAQDRPDEHEARRSACCAGRRVGGCAR